MLKIRKKNEEGRKINFGKGASENNSNKKCQRHLFSNKNTLETYPRRSLIVCNLKMEKSDRPNGSGRKYIVHYAISIRFILAASWSLLRSFWNQCISTTWFEQQVNEEVSSRSMCRIPEEHLKTDDYTLGSVQRPYRHVTFWRLLKKPIPKI